MNNNPLSDEGAARVNSAEEKESPGPDNSYSPFFQVRIWGARGSIPTPGPNTVKYGGNTACVEVRCGDKLIILDAGSGIRQLGMSLDPKKHLTAYFFFSHLHWDHIQGFPFFRPGFQPGNRFHIYAKRQLNTTVENLLAGQMMYPHFPKSLEDMAAQMTFHELDHGDEVRIGEALITCTPANHPDGCITFRIEYRKRSLIYATDTEHFETLDPVLKKHSSNADCLIYDAMFTEEEYLGKNGEMPRAGWGHSTWKEGVKMARAAGVKRLVLFHHDPAHDDDFISGIEADARREFPQTYAAYEGLTFNLLEDPE
jgi:phosphoribosyl 1,2-cyclic phosphodiesterase